MSASQRLTLQHLRRFSPIDFLSSHYLQQLLDSLQYIEHKAGSLILRRGEHALALYFLLEGEVWLGAENRNRHLQAGSPEACRALNENQPQDQDIGARSDVRLFAVERSLLERLLNWSEAASYEVGSLQVDEVAEASDDWLSKLLRSPLFGRLPPAHLHLLLGRFEFIEVAAGASVVRYGEPGEHFYVLKQGRAQVSLPGSDAQEPRQELHSGDFFGEEALVSGCRIGASDPDPADQRPAAATTQRTREKELPAAGCAPADGVPPRPPARQSQPADWPVAPAGCWPRSGQSVCGTGRRGRTQRTGGAPAEPVGLRGLPAQRAFRAAADCRLKPVRRVHLLIFCDSLDHFHDGV